MDRLLSWIRDHPQFAALGFGMAVLAVVMAVLAITMARAGASLRPLIWFLGFFAIIAGPQATIHFLDGLAAQRAAQAKSTPEAPSSSDAAAGALAPVAWTAVFGPEADPALITDAKRGLSAVLGEATEAKLAFNTAGESALAARFPSAAIAARALNAYGTFFAFADAQGSDASGWTARRHAGQGEWVHVVSAGPELYAWTSANKDSVLANRERALGPIADGGHGYSARWSGSDTRTALPSKRLTANPGWLAAIVALNLSAAVWWFFKGAAWTARVDASATALRATAEGLRRDLQALNGRDVPAAVTLQPDGSLAIDWRYADARWFDLMRIHQLKRSQRLVLTLDESRRTVRVQEFWSVFDASADAKGLRLDWKWNRGIQFFAIEHKRVLGVQLGNDGRLTGEMSQAYTFDLQTLKRPVIEAVTGAGWRWQPVVWDAPVSLRWLTE